jgi:hypothetical protein
VNDDHHSFVCWNIDSSIGSENRAKYSVLTSSGDEQHYDIVVIATPLEFENIKVVGIPHQNRVVIPPRKFQTIHTNIIKGRINPGLFIISLFMHIHF